MPARPARQNRARPGTAAVDGDQPVEIRITVDGRTYTFSVQDASSEDAAALRRATGMSLRGLMEAAVEDFDIDICAALVWLVRRRDEPMLRYVEVAEQIGYDTPINFPDFTKAPDQQQRGGKIKALEPAGDDAVDPTSQAS